MTPDISVVLPTYQRKASLLRTIESVLAQQVRSRFELIVVDNNSSDGTGDAVARVARTAPVPVRCVLETRQGVSHARNAGIAAARAPIVAFVDDDVRVAPDWLERIAEAMAAHPAIECVGGKVLPDWEGPPPDWLTRDHWGPIALLDQGDAVRELDAEHNFCLLTANMACRREAFERTGPFRADFQRVRNGIGSLEDHDWLLRFWAAGGRALYLPRALAVTDVPVSRMRKAYHRRWHTGHGHYWALLREPSFERTDTGRLLGVPAHAYRSAAADALGWAGRLLRFDAAGAFLYETRLRFFLSYFRTRSAEHRARVGGRSAASPAR
jgi:glycosyltransferase involved in cell wall biosynthesis